MKKDTRTMQKNKVEVSAVITKVDDNPAEITYFTQEGKRLPQDTKVEKEVTEAGTKFFTAQ